MSSPLPAASRAQTAEPLSHTEERALIRTLAPRLVVLALALVVLQALFGYSYMKAFSKPATSGAPVIVVGATEGNAGYIANKLNATAGHPVRASISTDKAAALEKIRRDEAVAVYVFRPAMKEKLADELYYSSAQGAARSQIAQTIGQRVAHEGKRTLTTHDIVPAMPNDPRGTAPFYLVLSWMIGAYILPAAISSLVGARSRTALGARLRLLLFAGYAVVSGLVGAWLATHHLDALPGGHYWQVAALGMAIVFAVSTFTYGLTSLFGTLGVGIAILLFVILGNPSSGGAFNYDVLPQPWRAIGPYLPNGAGVDAVRSIVYFKGVALTRPLWVLAAWGLAGLWMIFMVGTNTYRFAQRSDDAPREVRPEEPDTDVTARGLDSRAS